MIFGDKFCPLGKVAFKSLGGVQSRQRIDRSTVFIQDLVDAIAGNCLLNFAPIAEIDRNFRDGTHDDRCFWIDYTSRDRYSGTSTDAAGGV
jgi:hypothetical protein